MAIKRRDGIVIYDSNADFAGMRKAGKVAAECLDYIAPYVQPGVTTGELDDLCRDFYGCQRGLFLLVWGITAIRKIPVFLLIM